MSRLLLIGVFLEVGLVLLVVPWLRYWDQNYFVHALPQVQSLITDPFVRGAVSGLGILNLLAGLAELGSLIMADRSEEPPSVVQSPRVTEE